METIITNEYSVFKNLIEKSTLAKISDDYIVIGLTDEDELNEELAIGCLVGHAIFNVFVIDSIYIDDDYRWLGGGRLLIERLENALYPIKEITSITVDCENFSTDGGHLEDFLEHMGFIQVPNFDYGIFETSVNSFFEGSYSKLSLSSNVKPLSKCDKKVFGWFINDIKKTGLSISAEELFIKPIDNDLTQILFNDAGDVQGFILATNEYQGRPEAYFYMVANLKASEIGKLFKGFATAARDKGFKDVLLDFDNPYVFGIISTFCKDASLVTQSYKKDIELDRMMHDYNIDIDITTWGKQ
ncbi:hypothetical protein SAMN05216351_101304 [Pseudobutyrivibrio sp. JW11]|uniref:hypothetical protein n=1 Tax=Pseudobutyrivibrio sp. JW11 TaxID=1855302 RepID=UPI0008E0AE05|nr:hypothetical protein [Pseudobutyrivibrio sp. JW11]SFN83049.1 hypothetical protein SAMN05216351_101304 [Pseudobutyrivibrio sp. JW11]